MSPTFWLTFQIKGRRVPIPLPIIFPLVLAVEILAILPVAIYAICRKYILPFKIVSGFYLSRIILAFAFYGRGFKIGVCDGSNEVRIGGRWRC